MPSFLYSCSKSDDIEDDDVGNTGDGTSSKVSPADGTINGYGYVDLGLSVKWAICNIGTTNSEGRGSYREVINGITGSKANEIAWNIYSENGLSAPSSIAGSSYDPVVSIYGGSWYLPTKADFEELINSCSVSFITYKGVIGIKLTSKINGHSLFLPLSGYNIYSAKWEIEKVGIVGEYCSSSVYKMSKDQSQFDFWSLYINKDKKTVTMVKDFGAYWTKSTIRPVTKGSGNATTCNRSCTANCSNNSTNSGCSNCSSSCSSGCKTNCDYNCASTCKSHCYGQCNDTCGGGCRAASKGASCSGCASTCYNRCYQACSYACSSNCESSCVRGSK